MGVRVAEILAAGASRYLATHRVATVVANACRAIVACRTAELGGHVKKCENGHVVRAWYNACRNRSCPRCSFYRVRVWLERQVKTLLGCAHHHIIFTVPHELNFLWLCNYVVLGELLFRAARDALFELSADPKYLGAKPGVIMALHTWGQQLPLHPHTHCLVTAGGVDEAGTWVGARRKSLLPAEPLKQLFRGKFLYGLRGLARRGKLRLPEGWGRDQVESLARELDKKRWNVHVLERYENPAGVLNYLGRYLNGGPIGESRLVGFDGERVSFRYKDYRDVGPHGPRQKVLTLDRDEFIRRYLQHIPPKGFHMVRGYGLYRRGGNSEALRRRAQERVPVTPELHAALTSPPPASDDPTEALLICPTCGARLIVVPLPRAGPLAIAA
jgi:hypothetical protein